jgi:hypothetical protein
VHCSYSIVLVHCSSYIILSYYPCYIILAHSSYSIVPVISSLLYYRVIFLWSLLYSPLTLLSFSLTFDITIFDTWLIIFNVKVCFPCIENYLFLTLLPIILLLLTLIPFILLLSNPNPIHSLALKPESHSFSCSQTRIPFILLLSNPNPIHSLALVPNPIHLLVLKSNPIPTGRFVFRSLIS